MNVDIDLMHKYFSPDLPKSLKDLVALIGYPVELIESGGNASDDSLNIEITHLSSLDTAEGGHLTFFADQKYLRDYHSTKASAVIVPNNDQLISNAPKNVILIKVDNPMAAYINILDNVYQNSDYYNYLGPQGADSTYESKMCVVSKSAMIGNDTIISPTCFIGRDVKIGSNCFIGPNVSITHAEIGDGCVIHSGTKIGIDGFGCFRHANKMVYIKQIGGVRIGSNVSIGANCTIDRGAIVDTVIGDHCALDNQVHIAHNVELGAGCIIAGQSAIAGNTKVGCNVTIAGQSGVVGHIVIGDGVTVAARSGVIKSVSANKTVAGFPATDVNLWRKSCVMLRKLAKK